MRHGVTYATAVVVVSLILAGCEQGPPMGEIIGKVTIDGQTPPAGSSISFIPVDGLTPTAGALLGDDGSYSVLVPVGSMKVEIRAPRPLRRTAPTREGPGAEGPAGGGLIEEMLPPKYNRRSELTIDVVEGENLKDWELSTKR